MTTRRISEISRRHFLATAGLAATAAWLTPRKLWAWQGDNDENIVDQMRKKAATAKITVQPLRGNISVLLGSGGNIAVLHGKDGKLLVDAGINTSQPRITEALAGLSPDPIKHLINTHWHFDHTDGNEWLHSAGAGIIAHENTRKHLSTATRVPFWNFTFPPSPAGALPATVIKTDSTLHLNGETLVIQYYGPSHTDGDLSVEFKKADVFHAGDTWWNGFYPFIDYSTGGGINGMIRATESTLARITAKTIVIPGHGPVGDKSQVTEYRDMLVTIRDKVAALKKQGKSIDEIIAAKPTAAYDDKWGRFAMNAEKFTRLVHSGV